MGSPPTLAQGRRKRASLGTLRFFNCALSLNRDGRVPVTAVIAAKCRRVAVPSLRVSSHRSRTACSAPFLNAARTFLKTKTGHINILILILILKKRRPCSKCHRQVGGETTCLPLARTRSREARRADILRRSRKYLKHVRPNLRSNGVYKTGDW